jgi:hypothetical protein
MKKVVSTLFFVFIIQIVHAQLASGTYAIGPSSSYSGYTTKYSTITAAVSAMSSGISGAVIFELQSDYVSTTETFPITIGQISGTSSSNTITIRPASGVTSRTISGSSTTQIFNLNGVDYLTIDGRPGGVGTTKQLTIANTSTSGTVLTFSADATYNTLTYLTIQGVNNTATSGNIVFSTGSSTGNTNNTINYCVLKDGASTPVNIIYSLGGSITSLKNSSILIDHNEIANFYLNGVTSCGILVGDYNDSWTISNNSFYQSSGRSPNTNGTFLFPINITESKITTASFTISGNYIGGSSALCSGTWSESPPTINHCFNAIRLTGTTTTSFSVQGNIIKNITIGNSNYSNGTATGGIFLLQGAANIGTTSGNIIGDMSSTGSFVF